ncbi:MAG: hypothetical protein OXN17_08080 [Candidatus Poribacteria bacterium]|nr:hypothetical protein [Candidatus Poribacteria bacterium]
MIERKAAMLRIVTCAVGGAVFLLLLVQLFPFGLIHPDDGAYAESAPVLFIFGVGAFLGLLPGIAWAIDQKSARRRFLLWSISGIVVGVILAAVTGRFLLMFAFWLSGVYVGVVSALKRLGMYKVQEDNQAAEGNELSE